jgi:hypothetical protein
MHRTPLVGRSAQRVDQPPHARPGTDLAAAAHALAATRYQLSLTTASGLPGDTHPAPRPAQPPHNTQPTLT